VLFDRIVDLLMVFFGGVLLVVAIGRGRSRKQPGEKNFTQNCLLIVLGIMLTSYLFLSASRVFVPSPFPSSRSALYWLPLTSCACLLGLRSVGNRIVTFAGALIALIFVLQYGLQFNISYYSIYRNNAGVKQMMMLILDRHGKENGKQIKIGASWHLADSINFYRAMYKANWMEPVTRDGPDCNYDYYLLGADDSPAVRRYKLDLLYRDEVSGVLLAKPNDSALRALETIYPPPLQTAPPCGIDPAKLGSFLRLGDPGTRPHIVRDIMDGCPRPWTFEHPMLLFRVDERNHVKFVMHFVIPDIVFSQTGPLTLDVWINAKRLGGHIYDNSGDQTFEESVPANILGP
jgi:hypothetical protein